MKALSFKDPWVSTYVERLLLLSNTTKRAIILALERSMGAKPPKRTGLSKRFWSAYGAWDSPETADELSQSIRTIRFDRDRPIVL